MNTDNAPYGALPNLIIIGAMKAGTSSLHTYLSLHPEIFMSQIKELNFFNTSLNWAKGLEWYKQQFKTGYKCRGETSPNYSKWEGTAKRMYEIVPDAKLVYVVRDPVERFLSECNHRQLDPDLEVEKLRTGSVTEVFSNGLYFKWYREFSKYYSSENILIIKSEDLQAAKNDTLLRILTFLGLDSSSYGFGSKDFKREHHKTEEKLIASSRIHELNKHQLFLTLKHILRPIKPLLLPLQKKFFYRKREIKTLNPRNLKFLKDTYQPDMKNLENQLRTNFEYDQ